MKTGIILTERYLIESLGNGDKYIHEIKKDTGLELKIINNIIKSLEKKEIVRSLNGKYKLNMDEKEKWLPAISSSRNVRNELSDTFRNIIDGHFYGGEGISLKFKKLWLSPYEKSIVDNHYQGINNLLTEVDKEGSARSEKNDLKQKHLYFWGETLYSSLIKQNISNI